MTDGLFVKKRRRVTRTVSIDPAIHDAIEALAIKEGVSFSEMFNRIIFNILYDDNRSQKLKHILDRIYLAKLHEHVGKLIVYKEALKKLEELEEELVEELDELRESLQMQEVIPLMGKLMDYFDTHGLEIEAAKEELRDILDKLNDKFIEMFGLPFDIDDFAQKVWLYEMPYEQYLYEKKELSYTESDQ